MESIDLSDFFKTKEEALDFSARLKKISEKVFENDFSVEKAFMEQFGIKKKEKFITLLRDNNINTESNSHIGDFFNKVQEKLSSLASVSLTIAFEPTEQTLKFLSEWFLVNTKKQVLFDIKVDRNLVAGALISSNGKYLDFSVRQKFDQLVKDAISQELLKNAAATPIHQTSGQISAAR